jgi:hypothetical protein
MLLAERPRSSTPRGPSSAAPRPPPAPPALRLQQLSTADGGSYSVSFVTDVVGRQHHAANSSFGLHADVTLWLQREADNPADPNAILVRWLCRSVPVMSLPCCMSVISCPAFPGADKQYCGPSITSTAKRKKNTALPGARLQHVCTVAAGYVSAYSSSYSSSQGSSSIRIRRG